MIKENKLSRGFTTIEFIIAGLFVGTLTIIAMSTFSTTRMEARDDQRLADVQILQDALAEYFDTFGGYPASLDAGFVVRGVLSSLPRDPRTGEAYSYVALNAGCTSYHLGALLEDDQRAELWGDIDAEAGIKGTGCPDGENSAADFSGQDPVYDIKP